MSIFPSCHLPFLSYHYSLRTDLLPFASTPGLKPQASKSFQTWKYTCYKRNLEFSIFLKINKKKVTSISPKEDLTPLIQEKVSDWEAFAIKMDISPLPY